MKFFVAFLFAFIVVAAKPNSRIIGGQPAEKGQFPWQVAIHSVVSNAEVFCGGALIADQWVLTAAQCVYRASSFTLKFGSIYSTGNEEGSVTVESTTAFIHEDFSNWLNNDVALIKLNEPIEFTDTIQPISLPSAGDYLEIFTVLRVSGWGKTDDDSDMSTTLNYADVFTLSNEQCAGYYGNQMVINSTVCAIPSPYLVRSTCIGDFGGALVLEMDGEFVHHGIASFAPLDACTNGAPAGYVRTESMLDFITSTTGLKVN